jgi:hypothetical protein
LAESPAHFRLPNVESDQVYHERAVERIRANFGVAPWGWRGEFVRVILFLRTSKTNVSPMEWDGWMESWRGFAGRVHHRHPCLACSVAYAVGIARADEYLMDMAFEPLRDLYPDEPTLLGVIRDIDRVVVFMKAATSKNRTDPIVRRQLATQGIRV